MKPIRFKPSQVAQLLNVNSWTVRRWIREGKIPSTKTETGRIFVPASWIDEQQDNSPSLTAVRCAIYVRESSSENKTALQTQSQGLKQYAEAKGYQIIHIVSEFGSGVNDNRPKLSNLLQKKDFNLLLVEHKDRLTRFGFRWFELLCPFRIEVVNIAENPVNDLMDDLVAILTSFSARLYGQRRGRKKTQAAIEALQKTE